MYKFKKSCLLCEMSKEELLIVDGGLPAEIIAALIASLGQLVGAGISLELQNATEQGKNDAYNDLKNDKPVFNTL